MAQPRLSEPTEYALPLAVTLPFLTPSEIPLLSTVPAVMCPLPSAVNEPMAAMNPEAL